jgi:hypothetical protein
VDDSLLQFNILINELPQKVCVQECQVKLGERIVAIVVRRGAAFVHSGHGWRVQLGAVGFARNDNFGVLGNKCGFL